jgi:hypothetical protein
VENVDEVFSVCFDREPKSAKKPTSPKAGRKGKGGTAASSAA